MTRRSKLIALGMMWLMISISVLLVDLLAVRIITVVLGLAGTVSVLLVRTVLGRAQAERDLSQ